MRTLLVEQASAAELAGEQSAGEQSAGEQSDHTFERPLRTEGTGERAL